MNNQQAREILSLYRPATADAQDAVFTEALTRARQDAELRPWFENHCANYETIRNRLKQIPVPANLKENILTGQKSRDKIVFSSRSFWRQPVFAMAAMIILLLSIAAFWFQPRAKKDFSHYRIRMVSTALRIYGMDLETNDLTQVRQFLAQKKAPADYALPPRLAKLECTGCVVLRWQNNPVSMICFRTGRPLAPGEKSDLYFFVTDRASIPNAPYSASPTFKQINKVVTASWIQGDKSYLLATQGGKEFIQNLF
ncbi:MAG: hypothetical protein M3Y82_02925 [Verrucomicrobiota bacterium]|nr:hypothetical protein [Verrucomicrobiota bacterium]